MNNLKSFNFKGTYDPSVDGTNILTEFYIPCLSVSKRYDRCSAYFSSAILRQYGSGLEEFCKHDGKIRFIFSCEIMDDEMSAIEKAYEGKIGSLSDALDESLDYSYEVANLSNLIVNNVAEVKIAFMLKSRSSIMHMKTGLFEDFDGNKVYFAGSGNETESGILHNAEIFYVFNSDEDKAKVEDGDSRFERIWNNTYSPESIRTEYPYGRLFEKLKSFNKGKIFNNQKEFFTNENCVFVDIEKKNSCIILLDYTSRQVLKISMVLKTYMPSWESIDDNSYKIDKLGVMILKTIEEKLELFKIKYFLSVGARLFIEENDLELEKRTKLGISIKQKTNQELWTSQYFLFKSIVDHETKLKLKDKQMEDAFFHYCMKSSANYSVPGTGKTFISYGLFAYLFSSYKKERDIDSLVVFGPLNCFKAWKEEAKNIFDGIHDFTIFDVTEHHSDFENALKTKKYNIYLVNYDFISSERVKILNSFVINSRTMLVFDEIHKLKSSSGKRANSFVSLIQNCSSKPIYKLALTGTPIPNSYSDIHNYFRILYPEDMNGAFHQITPLKLKNADNDYSSEELIKELIYPTFVRTTKKDLMVPPASPDDTATLLAEPSDSEKELYSLIWKSAKNPLVKFIRLIQASSNPALIKEAINLQDLDAIRNEDDAENEFSSIGNDLFSDDILDVASRITMASKTKKTIDKIAELVGENEKVIVWCLFVNTIDLVIDNLKKLGISCESVCGRDDVRTRDRKIDSFKYGDISVLVTNPNTLAESVSLHKACHNAIYLEYGFNLTYLLQSKDRIHRVGLEAGTETNYYFAITNSDMDFGGSIDKMIYDRLGLKAKRMIDAVESNNLVLVPNTNDMQDILDILKKF